LTSDLGERVDSSRRAKPANPGPNDDALPEVTIEVEPHNCFACGELNEHGLHLELHVDGDRCWTALSIPTRFQGWDDIAHGGIVCTILDEVMAWSLAATDNWGLTARMSVEFRKPVPLGRPIRGEGWISANRRRLIETGGRLTDVQSGELLAAANATYVAADPERKRQLQARYRFRLARATVSMSADCADQPNEARP
jgi:acyl-coenzyme A thioesterase PaaI-like protein